MIGGGRRRDKFREEGGTGERNRAGEKEGRNTKIRKDAFVTMASATAGNRTSANVASQISALSQAF